MNQRKLLFSILLLSIICVPCVLLAQTGKILLYGSTFTQSAVLHDRFSKAGFQTALLNDQQLADLDINKGRLLVLAGDQTVPAHSRMAISKFLSAGGHLLVAGKKAFDYAPEAKNPVILVKFAQPNAYKIIKPLREKKFGSQEKPSITLLNSGAQRNGIELKTLSKGMSDVMVQFPVKDKRSPSRSVLTFNAHGNHYMDLLALEIKDQDGRIWYNFVPITREWKTYTVSLADFIPGKWSDPKGLYPLLEPEKIDSLAMGTNLMTVWSEKEMAFAVDDVCLAENTRNVYAPTSALMRLRLPFQENGMAVPQWLIDPFHPLIEFPGSRTGTDTRQEYDLRTARESRPYPDLQAADAKGQMRNAGTLRIHAGGMYKGASVATFINPPAEIISDVKLLDLLVSTAEYMIRKPKVISVNINTSPSGDVKSAAGKAGNAGIVPRVSVAVSNPTSQSSTAKLLIEAGEMLKKEINISLGAQSVGSHTVDLPAVPQNFPFKKFTWKVTLTTPQYADVMEDTVDVERAMIFAFKHLLRTQQEYPDGRFSNHYFGDAYGVRAMFAYTDFLKRNPLHLQSNNDLWKTISPGEIEASATRFCDMLLQRQNPEGSMPMGYSEHTRGYNVADGGQIALSLAQLSPYVSDLKKRADYLRFCYKFADWAETFYIDSALSAKLLADPKVKPGEAKAGLYGLGMSGNTRRPYGPSWVLSDILAVQLYLGYVDKNDLYKRIADRNAHFYVSSMYNAAGYYQSEALFWIWKTTSDRGLKAKIKENLQETFLPPLYAGKANDMFTIGSRGTLRVLPLLYYQREIGDDANIRAVLLKNVWSFGSGSSVHSMQRIAETFGKPVHGESLSASKYAALSALWAMEMLSPGSTMARFME